jgi:hypothetical protein
MGYPEEPETKGGDDWQFTTADVRSKLKRLYPQLLSKYVGYKALGQLFYMRPCALLTFLSKIVILKTMQ